MTALALRSKYGGIMSLAASCQIPEKLKDKKLKE